MDDEARVKLAGRVLLAAGTAMFVGSFLPWAVLRTGFGTLSKNGVEGGDGIATALAGVILGIIAAVILSGRRPGRTWIGVLVLSAMAMVVAAIDMADVSNRAASVDSEFASANIGSGLYLIAISALVASSTIVVLFPSAHVSLGRKGPPLTG